MNISLPDQLKEFADGQVDAGRYNSVSEYVNDLIREDEKRKALEQFEALLVEGAQSGESSEMVRQDWTDIRTEAILQFEARKARKSA
jgi:antitoxin ParD1/3/4